MSTSTALTAGATPGEIAMLDGIVAALVNTRAAIGALQAFETQLMHTAAAIADDQAARGSASSADAEIAVRSIAAELAAALRVSDRTVQRGLFEAQTISRRFPASLDALGDGRISRAHLGVIVDAGTHIDDDEARAEYERRVIARAANETAGRLRPIARALAERAQSRTIDERHRDARATRRVVVIDLDDGLAELVATIPAALAHGIHDRLTTMGRAVQNDASSDAGGGPGPRTIDELRADLLCDLALAGAPTAHGDGLDAIAGRVQITVPALTLAGVSSEPAMLPGHGPVDTATARDLAAAAPGWDRVLVHPDTGAVLAVDRYRPSEELRRVLRARDEHCRFPGCRLSTVRCDLDHTHDAALGGTTDAGNLAHLCRRHHVLKHNSAWRVEQQSGGILRWTSPTGRTYVDSPAPMVRFTANDPPPF